MAKVKRAGAIFPMYWGNDSGRASGLVRAARRESEGWHQTEKPVGLMERLIEVVPPGGLILDPFAGSSTTLVAARNRGRHGLGFEISDTYLETSGKRLDQLSMEAA